MKKSKKKCSQKILSMVNSNSGAMMLEYVVLVSTIAICLFATLTYYDLGTGEFVGVGKVIPEFFQRILSGIAMPIP